MRGAGVRREAVKISVGEEGLFIQAVLSSPLKPPNQRRVVIFSQAGLQNKGGVGDYFRWLGDELSSLGYDVLRFDQLGTGDSEGEILEDVPLEKYFLAVQSGASTGDTKAALAWAIARYPRARIYLWGQCGGGIPSLQVAADAPDQVAGLILLALPVLYSRPMSEVRELDARVAGKGYLYKLKDPAAYLRLLSGKSDYHLIKAALRSVMRRVQRLARRRVRLQLERFRPEAQPDHAMFNDRLWSAFQEVMANHVPTLLLMAAIDNETPEFDEEFRDKVLKKRPGWGQFYTVEYLEEADHSLMIPEARQRSLEAMVEWLERHP